MIHTNVDPDVSRVPSQRHTSQRDVGFEYLSFIQFQANHALVKAIQTQVILAIDRFLSSPLLPLKKSRRRMQSWQITIHFHGESLNHWMCIRDPLFLSHFFLSFFSSTLIYDADDEAWESHSSGSRSLFHGKRFWPFLFWSRLSFG